MAVVSQITCKECGVQTHVSHAPGKPPPKKCGPCRNLSEEQKRESHLASLAKLSTDERIRKIEEWIYDYRPNVDPWRI